MPIAPPPPLKAGLFGRGGAPKQPKATPTGAPPPKPPPGVRIEHRVGVQAPPEVIWEVLTDLAAWEQWNPLYPKASGEIRIGSTLDITLALPGEKPQQIQPTVLEWVPNDQLHWKLTMLGGLVKTLRFLEIEKLADESCIVSNGEYIGGVMGPSAARRMGQKVYRGFREMDEALKARAELLWQRRK
ncbi:MAG: SRPBCC family protein [Phenylobacterium sp.]